MKWVLIWVVSSTYANSTGQAYFETYDSCKVAKLQLEMLSREFHRPNEIHGFCTPVSIDLGPEGGRVR